VGEKHRDYKEDPRKLHDGTIEFTSIDAHKGVAPSRRGDLKILGYVLLRWACGQLPWEDNLSDKNCVKRKKQEFMVHIECSLPSCFSSRDYLGELLDYFKYVKTLKYSEKPDYDYVRNLFAMALQKRGHNSDGVFDWVSASHVQRSPQMRKKVSAFLLL
jgi:vaccinia related kinase